MTGQQVGEPVWDSWDRTAWTEQSGWDSQNTRQPGHDHKGSAAA